MRLFRKKIPYTKQLAITPPRPAPDRAGIAVVTCVKNEGRYIADWLKFHQAVGVVHFYIYDNGSTDDGMRIVEEVLDKSAFTIIPWAGGMVDVSLGHLLNWQAVAFAHAILNFGSRYKWMAFIDVDEFLLPKKGRTIEEALAGAKGAPNISLPWHMFGTSGHKSPPKGSILRNFTRRSADPLSSRKNASNFKCIVDPCEVSEVSIHHFSTAKHGENSANDVGSFFSRKGRKHKAFYSSECIQLNHYYSKSEEELREKLSRGPASPASRKRYEDRVLSAMKNIEADTVEDNAMIAFLDKHKIDCIG